MVGNANAQTSRLGNDVNKTGTRFCGSAAAVALCKQPKKHVHGSRIVDKERSTGRLNDDVTSIDQIDDRFGMNLN